MSIIIPLLKSKKPADESTSYRLVSLLCPAIKILERLILPSLTELLPVPEVQHGFRQNHSTVKALNDFNEAVAAGFNKKRRSDRTVLLQIDISKSFDMVSHEKLLRDLDGTTLPEATKRWLSSYLHGRQSRVNFRNTTSSATNVRTGVPQGAVTSPILFNIYLNKIPNPPAKVNLIKYADDISVYISGTDIKAMSAILTEYAKSLVSFLNGRDLIVSAEKSTVTLFTPDTNEYEIVPIVKIDNQSVQLSAALSSTPHRSGLQLSAKPAGRTSKRYRTRC